MTEPAKDEAAVMTYTTKLNQYIDEGRLIRHAWEGRDDQGRETACLLAAMSPEVAVKHDASACPASIMPQWLAHLTPWMDDEGSAEAWPEMVRRYAAVAARWHVLTDETWRRLDYTARRLALAEAGADSEQDAAWRTARIAWRTARAAVHAAADEFAGGVAWVAAADRITAAILTAIEQSCDEAEKENDQ